jgi:adenylyl cyclase-associated protein
LLSKSDNCKKTGLVLDSVVSTVDVVNTKSSQIQILGVAPTVLVDKTDGLQLFVSKASIEGNIEVFSAKSSELNVLIEGEGEDGGFAERAVPEQMKIVIKNGKLLTSIVEHKG